MSLLDHWTARSLGDRFIRKYYQICLGSPLLAQNGNAMSDGGVSAPGAAGGARSPTTHRTFLRAASSRVVLALRPRVGSDAFALQPPWKRAFTDRPSRRGREIGRRGYTPTRIRPAISHAAGTRSRGSVQHHRRPPNSRATGHAAPDDSAPSAWGDPGAPVTPAILGG